ncbi:hypothetical protein [Sphingomonas sp. ERG5]|uniref:hypothetical protein n=1 Tax=Sphingomonas sp. ERG5 TaxID=1381597 RepID=UPI001269F6EA|nr:hypothetical protein [Sphingomonas sp. ERG5]
MTGLRIAALVAAPVLLIPLLVACQQELPVAVTAERGQVVFSVPATNPPCVNEIRVAPASAPKDSVWAVDSSDSKHCHTRFAYGALPAGFTQIVAAEPLKSGRLYLVAIERPGAMGITFFEPGKADGSIERDPPAN